MKAESLVTTDDITSDTIMSLPFKELSQALCRISFKSFLTLLVMHSMKEKAVFKGGIDIADNFQVILRV